MNSIGIAGFNLLTISIDKMRVLSATGVMMVQKVYCVFQDSGLAFPTATLVIHIIHNYYHNDVCILSSAM